MLYLNYDEYVEVGGELELSAFDRFALRATTRIRHATQNRIDRMETVPVEVKHLCRDLIEYLHNHDNVKNQLQSASQSQGGVSESESYVIKSDKDMENEIWDLMDEYIRPLLYRGCNFC